MRITIFGTGYVGLVTGTCLADAGHEVMCMDVDSDKITGLENGIVPIYEPGLEALVKQNVAEERLLFTTDPAVAANFGTLQFIAVGTPPDEDGSADLQYVLSVASTIGQYMNGYKVVIDKSTVPVGTADKVRERIEGVLAERVADLPFDVCSNPEFLKEGSALEDFTRGARIVVTKIKTPAPPLISLGQLDLEDLAVAEILQDHNGIGAGTEISTFMIEKTIKITVAIKIGRLRVSRPN